jgi:hypothetical protein
MSAKVEEAELARRIAATDAGILLVPSRILRRVIKRHRNIPGIGLDVPHAGSYVVDKADLLSIATPAELGRSADDVPASVLLLPFPEDEGDREAILTRLWRAAFHASIHRELERKVKSGELSPAVVRSRIHRVGQTEFDEVRQVLRQDELLLAPQDQTSVYVELVATYLELSHFDPDQLARTFPALTDAAPPTGRASLPQLMATDLDVPALLAKCRPDGALPLEQIAARARVESTRSPFLHRRSRASATDEIRAPPPPRRTIADEPPAITKRAQVAEKKGNLVRAMMIRSRVGTRGEAGARQNLHALCRRLATALHWSDAPVDEWANVLFPLVAAAGARRLPWNAESSLLYDLLRACLDHEREISAISVVEWALSFGKRPVQRPLPAQREVRVAKHIRSAADRVASVGVEEKPRQLIHSLMVVLEDRAEANIRRALRPKLQSALAQVGLVARNVPEQVSEWKLIEELVDQIVEHRFLSFSQVRDAISRNQVKLKTLRPKELVMGDALLALDRILALSLDGVYRPAEIYLRGLQKLSSITFGTVPGRLLVLYLLLPVVCAYVALEGVQHVVGPILEKGLHLELPELVSLPSLGVVAAVLFVLIHSSFARFVVRRTFKVLGFLLRVLLVRMPLWFWERKLVQAIVKSRPVQFVGRWVLKPAALTAVGSIVLPFLPIEREYAIAGACVFFVVVNVVLNTRAGAIAEEAALDWVMRTWRRLHKRILPGMFAFIAGFFRGTLETMDRTIYAVDELLRFRQGEGRVAFYLKGGLGILWFIVTYLIRLYVNLLIEPEINPIKHFPVVTVAAKLMIPITPTIHAALSVPLNRLLGGFLGETIAVATVFVLPGFFGFLVWELKENWRLYEQNRARALEPVVIGHHGETMIALMRPGLHSGTIPKIYSRLRRAAQKGKVALYKQREALGDVETALRRFVERELVGLLDRAQRWKGGKVVVGMITMASNRIRIELLCPGTDAGSAEIAFEEQSGLLLGTVSRPGFIDTLEGDQRIIFENALAGLYKVAGVDLVREQVDALLGGLPWDVTDDGLLVWPDGSWATEVLYDLGGRGKLKPVRRMGDAERARAAQPLQTKDLLFREGAIPWSDWVASWAAVAKVERLVHGATILSVPAMTGAGRAPVPEADPSTAVDAGPPTVVET